MAHLDGFLSPEIPNPTYVELIFPPDSMRCALLRDLFLEKFGRGRDTDGFDV